MNRFLTEIYGRMPVVLNDIRFMDNSTREAFTTIFASLVANKKILHGCSFTNNGDGTYNVSAGAVVIGLETYVCEAQTFACTDIAQAYFVISETYDSEGRKRLGDSSERETYQIRRVVCQQHALQPEGSLSVNVARFEDYYIKEGDGRLTDSRRCNNDFDDIVTSRSNLDVFSKLETSTLITNAVDALIAGAPGALDTLNELAAAIGDNSNYAATITNLLAEKEPIFSKNSAFNKNFAGSGIANTVSKSDHNHMEDWTVVTSFGAGFGAYTGNASQRLRYRRFNNGKMLQIVGRWETVAGFNESYNVFTLPAGYRPSNEAIGFARRLGQSVFEVYVQPDGVFYDSDGWADFTGTRDTNVIVPLD